RKLYNEELHNLYSSPSIIRMIKSRRTRWAGHIARMGETRNAYRILVGKPEGKRPLGRPRSRWEDNIKMDLREIEWDGVDVIDLAQNRDQWRALVNTPGGSNSVTIQWGFCIPSTCGAEDMRAGLSTVLHRDVTVTLSELDCHTNEGKKLKIIDYVAIAVFVTFGLSVILSTSYDLLKKGRGKQILISFSLYTNGRKLLSTKDSPETLTCLSGIRILSICWIVLGHRYLLSMNVPSINAITGYGFISDWSTMVIINSVLAVDTFLLVSGLLVAYGQLGHVDRRQKFLNVPLYYLHRYIRLTPALAVMVLMQLSLIEHMGSGPLWDKGNKHLTQLCQENWWSALLYVQNYVSDYRMLQVYTGWMLSALGCFSAIYWRLPFQQPDYKYNVYISAIYACLNRPIWAFAVGWVIYACVTGYGGPVDKLLSWGAFKPLGRLTYCIYLVHFTYILYRQLTTRTPIYINGINLMSQVVSDVFFSILFAALLSLGFEVPALNVEKVLLRAERADKSDIVQRKSVEDGRINQGFAAKDNR
ncbi:hypothetical protein B7P43_G10362, partial [Cryptotermes secundus]